LKSILEEGGACGIEAGTQPISSPEAWWSIIIGSGYRGALDALDADARERVREAIFAYIRDERITEVEANVVYALAKKN
jgi:hypothetical protein